MQGQLNLVLEEEQRAAHKRQQMYDKLSKIDTIEAELKRLVPLVDKHEERHNQTVGAMHFGRWMWTLIAGASGAGVLSLIQWLADKHK